MEQLKDVISYFVRRSGRSGLGRTVLTKLVYFAELESWERRGVPLTGTSFYRLHYGAWAPDVPSVAESIPGQVEHTQFLGFYFEHRYRLRSEAAPEPLDPEVATLLDGIFDRYGRMTAANIGALSKKTPPMLAALEAGTRLDLSVVAPRHPSLRIRHQRLAEAQGNLDRSTIGSREELDSQALQEHGAWVANRRRTAAS